ncbi:MAG: methyltransferase domain-containing protein [Treponema sp.]|nr:methyltransferase domain-containing protein [Treponema sp.]
MIDYTKASKTYDNTRNSSDLIIDIMSNRGVFGENKNILDFGCGTGNYLQRISFKFPCNCYGAEPSIGMREKAIEKNPGLTIADGNHENLPFEDNFFDFVFMTDVIHHVPDLNSLFKNLYLKLTQTGLVCIVTEGWKQIESRWYNNYFPSLSKNEKNRYPDIDKIVTHSIDNGFSFDTLEIKKNPEENEITSQFIKLVEEKGYSMFRILDEDEYTEGLSNLKRDLGKIITTKDAGETLIWLRK